MAFVSGRLRKLFLSTHASCVLFRNLDVDLFSSLYYLFHHMKPNNEKQKRTHAFSTELRIFYILIVSFTPQYERARLPPTTASPLSCS